MADMGEAELLLALTVFCGGPLLLGILALGFYLRKRIDSQVCPHCGRRIPYDVSVCPRCRRPLVGPEDEWIGRDN